MATRIFPEQRQTLETLLGALSAGLPASQGLSTLMSTIDDARAEQEQRQEMKRARRTARTERIGSFQDLIVQRASEGAAFTDVAEEVDILGDLAGLGNRADRELGRSLHTVYPGAGTPGHVEGSPGGISPLAPRQTGSPDPSELARPPAADLEGFLGDLQMAADQGMTADRFRESQVNANPGLYVTFRPYFEAVIAQTLPDAAPQPQGAPQPQPQPQAPAPPPQPSAGQSAGETGGGALLGAILGKLLPWATGPIGAGVGALATGSFDERPRTDLSSIPPAVRAAITKVQQARQQASPRSLEDLLG